MTSFSFPVVPQSSNRAAQLVRHICRTLRQREPRLFLFAMVLLAMMVPAAVALGIDERTLRGVNVWVKPMKFMASVALLALTTAWFLGHLPAARRSSGAVRAIVWTVIAAGGFEVGYITLQAALGQASHYNNADAFHAAMYTLMGLGALALTATQPALALQIGRHGDVGFPPAYRLAVLAGLWLTFVLGAGAGMLLGGMQPTAGASLPVVGWSMTGGDLRVAHFVGIHASQVLPAFGWVVAQRIRRGAQRAFVWVGIGLWSGLFVAALAQALTGRPLIAA